MTVEEHSCYIARGVAVGNFDGVHRGHRLLLEELKRCCAAATLRPAVVTFSTHPLALIAPERAPRLLQTSSERRGALHALGLEVIELPFTDELRHLSAHDFLQMLASRFHARLLLLGHDNRFGYCGSKQNSAAYTASRPLAEEYAAMAAPMGMKVVAAPELPGISSSAIRKALGRGDVKGAAAMLGYPYHISAIVEHGQHLGRTLGFPTANMASKKEIQLPAAGVYAGCAILADGSRYPAMTNIGHRPTVAAPDAPLNIESHLDGFCGDLYGQTITVEFHSRLREECRFRNLPELRNQLEQDLAQLRCICSANTATPD